MSHIIHCSQYLRVSIHMPTMLKAADRPSSHGYGLSFSCASTQCIITVSAATASTIHGQ